MTTPNIKLDLELTKFDFSRVSDHENLDIYSQCGSGSDCVEHIV